MARAAVREAQRDAADSGEIAARIHRHWGTSALAPTSADLDFVPDPRTGVEALAFIVDGGSAASAAVILRLPGEFPDSFEPVVTDGSPSVDPEWVRRTFFAP